MCHEFWSFKNTYTISNGSLSCSCYHAFVLLSWTINLWERSIQLFPLWFAFVIVFCQSDIKITKITSSTQWTWVLLFSCCPLRLDVTSSTSDNLIKLSLVRESSSWEHSNLLPIKDLFQSRQQSYCCEHMSLENSAKNNDNIFEERKHKCHPMPPTDGKTPPVIHQSQRTFYFSLAFLWVGFFMTAIKMVSQYTQTKIIWPIHITTFW